MSTTTGPAAAGVVPRRMVVRTFHCVLLLTFLSSFTLFLRQSLLQQQTTYDDEQPEGPPTPQKTAGVLDKLSVRVEDTAAAGPADLLLHVRGLRLGRNLEAYELQQDSITAARRLSHDLPAGAGSGSKPNPNDKELLHAEEEDGAGAGLDDIFIAVKTTKIFHPTRLQLQLDTWGRMARQQTYFFTDGEADGELKEKIADGHLINTNCSAGHNRKALCCKMAAEYEMFLESNKRWFCHFDDDNYVNVPALVKFLSGYKHMDDWYLGKPSTKSPISIKEKMHKTANSLQPSSPPDHGGASEKRPVVKFWFATGGAGFCLSRSLALKMRTFAGQGRFAATGERIRLPDDVTMGFIIEHLIGKNLTKVSQFHSHLEPMSQISPATFQNQLSFSYNVQNNNVIRLDSIQLQENDPTRFKSLHCFLFPNDCRYSTR